MSTNPYQSPGADTLGPLPSSDERLLALRHVRIALLILLLPAGFNFVSFNFPDPRYLDSPIYNLFRALNAIGFVAIAGAVWFLGLAVLEGLTRLLHAIFARRSEIHDWRMTLYLILGRAPAFAIAGAVLWTIWVAAFYQLQVGFYTISVPIGIASHLLAAGLYLPLFYRWYQTERIARQSMP